MFPPSHKCLRYDWQIDAQVIESLDKVTLCTSRHRDNNTCVVTPHRSILGQLLEEKLIKLWAKDRVPIWNRVQNNVFLSVCGDHLVVHRDLPHDSIMEATWHIFFVAFHRFPIVPINESRLVWSRPWLWKVRRYLAGRARRGRYKTS